MDDHNLAPEPETCDAAPAKKPYVSPRLELLDIEDTRNGPGLMPDSGTIDFS